jgi:hypothetical protein
VIERLADLDAIASATAISHQPAREVRVARVASLA